MLELNPSCLNTFYEKYAKQLSHSHLEFAQLVPIWARFLELCALDPYTKENVQVLGQGQEASWKQIWVEAVVEICKRHDSEFSLILEESMTCRFNLAVTLMENEGRTPSNSLA